LPKLSQQLNITPVNSALSTIRYLVWGICNSQWQSCVMSTKLA